MVITIYSWVPWVCFLAGILSGGIFLYFGDKGYFRIKGKVEMFKTGKYFDLAISLSKPPLPKMAVLVSIDEVFDLSAGNIVELN